MVYNFHRNQGSIFEFLTKPGVSCRIQNRPTKENINFVEIKDF